MTYHTVASYLTPASARDTATRTVKPRAELHAMSINDQRRTCRNLQFGYSFKYWDASSQEAVITLVYDWKFRDTSCCSNFHALSSISTKMAHHDEVEFKTLDGLTLRGWLYPASKRGPGIVITPGVSLSELWALFVPSIPLHVIQITKALLDTRCNRKPQSLNLQLFFSSSTDKFLVQLCQGDVLTRGRGTIPAPGHHIAHL